jgi:hypothetical protein
MFFHVYVYIFNGSGFCGQPSNWPLDFAIIRDAPIPLKYKYKYRYEYLIITLVKKSRPIIAMVTANSSFVLFLQYRRCVWAF